MVREKKNILLYIAKITMYIYMVTVASVQMYTFLHPLMWVILEENYVNFDNLYYTHFYTHCYERFNN